MRVGQKSKISNQNLQKMLRLQIQEIFSLKNIFLAKPHYIKYNYFLTYRGYPLQKNVTFIQTNMKY
jgi:hypothetical protein